MLQIWIRQSVKCKDFTPLNLTFKKFKNCQKFAKWVKW